MTQTSDHAGVVDEPIPEHVHLLGRSVHYKWIVAAVFSSAMFLDVLDLTIVNVALPDLGRQLHSGAVEWVVLGYTLALAVSIPAAGWWSDRIGTKRAFLMSLALFVLSSALCGFAQSMGQLIAFRVIQGVGGGMMTPIGISLLYRAFPPRERARAATIVMFPTLAAPALGPIVGGILVTNVDWRWIFWVNLPIGVLSFIFGYVYLREYREPSAGHLDVPGFILSAGGLALAVYALSEGPDAGWTSNRVVGCGLVGISMLVAYVFVELRVSAPMIDLRLLHNRMFRNANIVMGLSMAAFLGLLFTMPLYLQNIRGYTALKSGLTTFPQALGVMTVTVVASKMYHRVGPRRLVAGGLWGSAVVMVGFTQLDAHTNLWVIRLLMFGRGLAAGMSFMPIQAASYATIAPADTGRAASLFTAGRQVAISIGVATMATILSAYTPLAGPPLDVQRALTGFNLAALAAVGFAALAGTAAFFLIKDVDAAATMRSQPVEIAAE